MKRAAQLSLAVVGLLAVLGFGIWFFGAVVSGTTISAIVLTGGWFALVGAAVLVIGARFPMTSNALRISFVTASVVLLAAGAYTSLHVRTVNETLETGVPVSVAAPQEANDLLAPQQP